jgi:hypothetical protein
MNTITRLTRFALVPILCCLGAAQAWAQDIGVGGDETTADRLVTSSVAWTVLVSEPVQLPNGGGHCVVTGSADAKNPNNGNNRQYRFTLSMGNANPAVAGAFERTVEFDANAVGMEEVSSTAIFTKPAGVHTIYWLARKTVAAAPNMTVTDNSMTFVCSSNLLDPLDGHGDGD